MRKIGQGLRGSLVAKNTAVMFLGQGGRTIIQAMYFVIIARALGADGYGAFVGTTAMVAIAAPFASLGSGNLLVKHVSRDRASFSYHWGNALLVTLASATVLSSIIVVASRAILPASIPLQLIITATISDLYCGQLAEISGRAFQAFEQLDWTAKLQVLPSVLRLIGAVVLGLVFPSPTAAQWGVVYLGSTMIAATVALVSVRRKLGRADWTPTRAAREWREGLYFAIGQSTYTIYNDIDKSMLARLSALESAGIYAAAYRLIEASFSPVRALFAATYARFFQAGAAGIRGSFALAAKLLPVACGYAVAVGCVLFLTAPLAPLVLGGEYANAVGAIRWLALLPLLSALQWVAADCLTGAGYQGFRSGVQIVIAFINAGLNLWLIPLFAWRGAAMASLASAALLSASLWIGVWWLRRITVGSVHGFEVIANSNG